MSDDYPSQRWLAMTFTGWAVFAVVLIGAISIALWAFGVFTADIKGRGDVQKITKSAPFRLEAYNHFYDLCAAVQSDEARLDAQFDELAAATSEDDKSRIRTNISGISSDRADAINQYNADVRKQVTFGQYRAKGLPERIDPTAYTQKGDHTSCGG